MEEAAPDREPDNGSGKGDTSGQSPAASGSVASGSVAVAAPPADAAGADPPAAGRDRGITGGLTPDE